jgi:hypothetical protein
VRFWFKFSAPAWAQLANLCRGGTYYRGFGMNAPAW